jgi:uncharacterized protein (TIGR02271 family)
MYTRSVQTGDVRPGKEIMSEQKTINVPLTHEEVLIERRPASGQVAETPIAEGETIRIPVREEQVNVSKQTGETGEGALGTRQVQETHQVSDKVHREEARIEREGDVHVQGSALDEATQPPEREKKKSEVVPCLITRYSI